MPPRYRHGFFSRHAPYKSTRSTAREGKAQEAGARLVTKSELIEESDAISLRMALLPHNHSIIGPEDIQRMKKGAILINTSRSPLFDEDALAAAVKAGHIITIRDVHGRDPFPTRSSAPRFPQHGAHA